MQLPRSGLLIVRAECTSGCSYVFVVIATLQNLFQQRKGILSMALRFRSFPVLTF
jgi:hypothetical protein